MNIPFVKKFMVPALGIGDIGSCIFHGMTNSRQNLKKEKKCCLCFVLLIWRCPTILSVLKNKCTLINKMTSNISISESLLDSHSSLTFSNHINVCKHDICRLAVCITTLFLFVENIKSNNEIEFFTRYWILRSVSDWLNLQL